MIIKTLYEDLTMQGIKLSQSEFCKQFNRCLTVISASVDDKYVFQSGGLSDNTVKSIEDTNSLYDDYTAAVTTYIQFSVSKDVSYYTMFNTYINEAYKKVWRRLSKGKTFGRKPVNEDV